MVLCDGAVICDYGVEAGLPFAYILLLPYSHQRLVKDHTWVVIRHVRLVPIFWKVGSWLHILVKDSCTVVDPSGTEYV